MLMKVSVSIVIPTCNDVEAIKPLVNSILKYTDLSVCEVIVAANGSPKSLKDYINKLGSPFKLVWSDERVGVASAFTMGCKEAKGEYIALMNDDVVLLGQWFGVMMQPFADEKVGITGKLHRDWSSNEEFIISFFTMIRKKVFDEIGYYDPAFNPYFGEDVDFCIRAKRAGWKIANVPNMPIYHMSKTEGNPTAKSAKIISQKSNILRERYNKESFGKSDTIWDVSKADNHLNSPELAKTLLELIPKEDLVIDLGCGNGFYCKFLEENGYTVIAIEGTEGINEKAMYKDIFRWNLAKDLILPGLPKNTTVISFEVGEHISKDDEAVFINNITKHAKRAILSWAVPGQGGDGHINERSNEYIINKMKEKGFGLDEGMTKKFRKAMEASPLWWFKNTIMVFDKSIVPAVASVNTPAVRGSVTVCIPTRNRYFTTLPLCIMSVINQTYKPSELIIYDDGEQRDLRNEAVYKNIFAMLQTKGIQWAVKFGEKKGQAFNHQRSIQDAKSEWIWRIDDDNVAENDVLEKLMKNAKHDVGAVGGLVIDPKWNPPRPKLASNKIEDIYLGMNVQWYNHQLPHTEEVDHLYSTFIYRKEAAIKAGGYDLDAPIHREETIITYRIKRAGYRVVVDTSAITWHLNEPSGGIRDDKRAVFEHCEQVFASRMKEWGIKPRQYKLIVLDNGMGDHLIFKKVLPRIAKKNPGVELIVASCYPDVFKDDKVTQISIGDAKLMTNIDNYNVYKWMWDNKWQAPIEEAYRKIYGV